MRFRQGATWAVLCFALLLTACGGGSGRQGTDVAVTGVGPTAAVAAGANAVFQMTVANIGSNPADDVTVVNLVGNQLALISVTCAASGNVACPATPSVSMALGTLLPGASLTFEVTVQLSAAATGSVSNTMTANFSSDTDRTNNSSTVTATASNTVSNLVVSGSGPGGTVTGGGAADFVMTVRNDGPDTATALQFVNNVGSFLAIKPGGITCVATGGGTCPATLGVTMDLDSLPAGASLAFTISTTVTQSVNTTVTNTFQASADTDSARSDNTFTATATVVSPQTGVFVTGAGPAATVSGGGAAAFTMTVGNAGPDTAPSVSIVDNVGSNLTFTGVTCVASGGATCPATLGPVMTATDMPASSTLVFTVNTVVASGTSGTLTNSMTVSADNDTNRNDNIATAVATAATPRASLVLTGTGPSAAVAGGETATFTMTVANSGPDAASGLRVVNTVGSNLSFIGATCTATAPAVCPATVSVVTDVGALPVGGKLTFNVNAVVAAGTNGAITNTLQASADNAFSTSGNSVVAVGQAFTARSSLAITTTSAPANVASGTAASFVMTLRNDGPETAAAVRLVNTVGGNLTLTGITCTSLTAGAACPLTTGPGMDVVNLPNGGQLQFTITATVALGTQGSVINTLNATVTSGARSETTAVAVGSAYSNNLVVSASAPAGPLTGGAGFAFTMTVANDGPGPALNVALVNTLGTGLVSGGAITCSAAGALCPAAPAATMLIPSIPANASLTFSVPVTVVAGTNGVVSSTLAATAAGDTRLQDSSATASAQVSSPDLAASLSGATQITAGNTAVFTAVVSNPTSTAATNLSLVSSTTATDALVNLSALSIVCTPSSGATCPTTGPTMVVPSLPAGRSLTFTITVPLPLAARGTVTSGFAMTAAGDPNPANNTPPSVTTSVIDPRNGSYKAFGGDGRSYDLTIDFDAGSYTLASGAQTMTRTFTADAADPTGKGYTVGGSARLRVASDLIIGGHDFGAGVLPFVAARSFGSALTEVVGQYNLVLRVVPATGQAVTYAAVAVVSGNQMFVCQTDNGSLRPPGSTCPVGKQRNYVLSVSGGVYAAVEVGGPDAFSFYLARSDAAKMLFGAEPTASVDGKLRIALQDGPSLLGGTLSGPSTSGSWIEPMTLTSSSYAATGGVSDTCSTVPLAVVANTGVGSMLTGFRSSDAQRIWVMQSAPLAIAFTDFTAVAPGSVGLLQIVLP
jgi:uncharacterized repeat protein (TIGR01451 family)